MPDFSKDPFGEPIPGGTERQDVTEQQEDPYAFPISKDDGWTTNDTWDATTGGLHKIARTQLFGGMSAEEIARNAALGAFDIYNAAGGMRAQGKTPYSYRSKWTPSVAMRDVNSDALGDGYGGEISRGAVTGQRDVAKRIGALDENQYLIGEGLMRARAGVSEADRQMAGGRTAAQGMLANAYANQLGLQQQGTEQAIRNSNALAMSQRGNRASAMRQAQLNEQRIRNQASGQRALLDQQYAGQMGQMRAQEMLGAQDQYAAARQGMGQMFGNRAQTSGLQANLNQGLSGQALGRAATGYDRQAGMINQADQLQAQNMSAMLAAYGMGNDAAQAAANMERDRKAGNTNLLSSVIGFLV